jgi:hypothetical protein
MPGRNDFFLFPLSFSAPLPPSELWENKQELSQLGEQKWLMNLCERGSGQRSQHF